MDEFEKIVTKGRDEIERTLLRPLDVSYLASISDPLWFFLMPPTAPFRQGWPTTLGFQPHEKARMAAAVPAKNRCDGAQGEDGIRRYHTAGSQAIEVARVPQPRL